MAELISKFFTSKIKGSSRRSRQKIRGFALISTLLLMVLLGLITVGLLGLSTVTMRTASREAARAEAQANARMALMLAIGQLQRDTGPDMRVTAPASIINGDSASSSNELTLTGVWKSWEGSDHTATGAAAGRPIAPDYGSKRLPGYSSSGRFLSWLVSKPYGVSDDSLISDDPNWSLSDAFQDIVSNAPFEGSIPLLSSGSLRDDDTRQVHVAPVFIDRGESQRGAYAWWVSGENQKARLPVPHKPTDDNDAAGWSMLAKSHSVADPSALDLDVLLAADGSNKAAKIISLNTSSLLVPRDPNTPDPAKQFHDMSVCSVGLMTNTATGGWRKDLSLFTENWNNLTASGVEVFRITPDATASATATMTRPTPGTVASARSQGSLFYPWSTYRTPFQPRNYGGRSTNYVGAVSSWYNLMAYATLYKQLTIQGGKPTIAARGSYLMAAPGDTANVPEPINHFNYLHQVRVLPLLGRLQTIYSYRSVPSSTTPGKYRVQIGLTPVGTIWNPYNVALAPFHVMHVFPRSLPPAFRFRIGSQYSGENYYVPGNQNSHFDYNNGKTKRTDGVWRKLYFGSLSNGIFFTAQNPAQNPSALAPGEAMVFNSRGSAGYNPATPTSSAYTHYSSDLAINIGTAAAPILVSEFDGADLISLDARFDSYSAPFRVGCFYEMRYQTSSSNFFSRGNINYDKPTADRIWPRMGNLEDPGADQPFPSVPVSAVTNAGVPFLSLLYGPRLTSTSGSDLTHRLASKGFQQTTPFMFSIYAGPHMRDGAWGAEMTGQLFVGGVRGAGHPVNTALDFQFERHSSWIDSSLPNCSQDGKNNGYLVSGTQSGDGLKRVVVAELPLRPLGSLAELQHWDLRMDNPTPPHQFYIIANSDAQPLFSPDAVIRNGTGIPDAAPNPSIDLQHDDSYCANHLLFDDWFFSTIAPQPETFGPTGKTLQETFTAWVSEGKPLDNRAYRPILDDSGISPVQATQLYDRKVNTADAYRTIASRLEVDGMFNVNSTSVKAWRALLGHARNQRMPYYDNNGDVVLSDQTDYAVSRTTVASDVAAGKNGNSGSFPGASEYSGYRVFTDEMLDQFAEEMVNQIRKRGPFLSLSEFVNRQLSNNSSDNQLALAGAVQSALNVLAANADADLNPYKELQDNSLSSGLSVLDAQGKGAGSDFHFFPEASEGKSAYGLPGWPRQADILRPLAPILSARDDTFTIRAYGDARDANGKIIARATCEAIVRRGREFVSRENEPDTLSGLSDTNERFGRRYHIISFRWLNSDEI